MFLPAYLDLKGSVGGSSLDNSSITRRDSATWAQIERNHSLMFCGVLANSSKDGIEPEIVP